MKKIHLDNPVPEKENEVLTRTQLKSIMGGTVSTLAEFNPCKSDACIIVSFDEYGQQQGSVSGTCSMKRIGSTVTCYCSAAGTNSGSLINSNGASHCWKGN